jgi:DNA-binding CsgD family transcriptional regulator
LTSTESLVVAYAARGLTTKETAYALGLSDSTIRVLMMRAVRRSGLKNRRALLDAWAERASPTGSATAR